MVTLLVVAVAGGLGAMARYVVTAWVLLRVQRRWSGSNGEANWGTHVVNISGALVVGLVIGMGLSADAPELPRHAIATGFLGGYTTFSAWMYETWRVLETGGPWCALGNGAGALVVGVAATLLGLWAGGAVI